MKNKGGKKIVLDERRRSSEDHQNVYNIDGKGVDKILKQIQEMPHD